MSLLEPSRLLRSGVSGIFAGLRTGDQRRLLLGAALVLVGWWRRSHTPGRQLVRRMVLRSGETLVVRLRPPGGVPDPESAKKAAFN